jgi:RimJ/RimL family protein N-acetyltransferase
VTSARSFVAELSPAIVPGDPRLTPLSENPLSRFTTERLDVRSWHHDVSNPQLRPALHDALRSILVHDGLAQLPPSLQLGSAPGDLADWIAARNAESDVSLVVERSSDTVIGLLILASSGQSDRSKSVHIGYLIGDRFWGRGFATEVVVGLLSVALRLGTVTLVGGVSKTNTASAHVLRKAGFQRDETLCTGETDTFTFQT